MCKMIHADSKFVCLSSRQSGWHLEEVYHREFCVPTALAKQAGIETEP